MNTRKSLQQYIDTELLSNEQHMEIDDNLLREGGVDSLGMMRLVIFVEGAFGIKVPPEDMIIENFRTIDLIAGYIDSRQES